MPVGEGMPGGVCTARGESEKGERGEARARERAALGWGGLTRDTVRRS